jgi:hypothetical protein
VNGWGASLKVKDRPQFAVFLCRDKPDALLDYFVEEAASRWPALAGKGCGHEFAAEVPPYYVDLPACPECGGPSGLLDLLRPTLS